MKIFSLSTLLTVLISSLVLLIYLSPYHYNKRLKKRSIVTELIIDAPVEEVFEYIGNSSNAKEWSTFVDSIIPLNAKVIPDGQVASIRRCYGKEKTIQWDETIVEVARNQHRVLSIQNMKGFALTAEDILTDQLYKPLGPDSTSLALTLFFNTDKTDYLDELKMYVAAYQVRSIFIANLQNIKNYVEDRSS